MRTQYTHEQVLFPSAARTSHPAAPTEVRTSGHHSLRFDIDITAFSGTSITFTVQFYDSGKGAWVASALATSALSATGHTILLMGPSITTASNAALQTVLPKRVRLMPSGTITSVTYSVTATLV